MEQYTLDSDIQVMYSIAPVFPDSVPDTYNQLEQKISDKAERRYFGYSQPNKDGVIVYRACAEILHSDEPLDYKLDTMTISAGTYASIFIENHFADGTSIPNAFAKLLHHTGLDPMGYCLEEYKNFTDSDVRCMVPLLAEDPLHIVSTDTKA